MRGLRRRALAICLVVLIDVVPAVTVLAGDPYRAGYLSLTAPGDPPVPVSVWYPTEAAAGSFEAGPYTIAATSNAPPAPGRHRLIVISHGSSGSDLGTATSPNPSRAMAWWLRPPVISATASISPGIPAPSN